MEDPLNIVDSLSLALTYKLRYLVETMKSSYIIEILNRKLI